VETVLQRLPSAAGLERNRALQGRHQGQRRCFVIGNGPSLKEMDLRPLGAETTIAMNSFYKHQDAAAVDLKYLCIGDESFMIDEPRSIAWHRTLDQHHPKAVLLVHEKAQPLSQRHQLHGTQEVFYFRPTLPVHQARHVNLDLSRRLNVGSTSGTLLGIPLALYLGFREIVLLGFDANWLEGLDRSYHFYDTHEYFPEFDSVATDGRGHDYEFELRSVLREFESHRLLRDAAASRGVSIVNATRGGLLDVYPRVDFAACFP
jgi:hypothetical protein